MLLDRESMRGYFNAKFLICFLLILRRQSWNQQADLISSVDILLLTIMI